MRFLLRALLGSVAFVLLVGCGARRSDRLGTERRLEAKDAKQYEPPSDTEAIRINERGVSLCDSGEYELARAEFDRALELAPGYAEAYCNRAITSEKLGREDDALSDYSTAIELNPKDAAAFQSRGFLRHKRAEYALAVQDYGRAIELEPGNGRTYLLRGAAWVKAGDYDAAIEDYGKAVELDGKNTNALFNLAKSCEESGRTSEAIAAYERLMALLPESEAPLIDRIKEEIERIRNQ